MSLNEFAQHLICPVCGTKLGGVNTALRCAQAHSFDIAREGYINLLQISQKQRTTVGDAKEMLQARRRFLERGYYQPLLETISQQVRRHLSRTPSASMCVAEVGCGEGYYIGQLKHFLDGQLKKRQYCFFGVDISKEAIKRAAKRYKDIHFIVADVKQKMFFAKGAIHVLLDIFAPRNAAEFDRIMARNGLLLIVIPNADHLMNLRASLNLIGIEANKQHHGVEQFGGTFKLVGEQVVEYDMRLDAEALFDLIQMTPNYWHFSEEIRDKLRVTESALTRASFTILEFSKC